MQLAILGVYDYLVGAGTGRPFAAVIDFVAKLDQFIDNFSRDTVLVVDLVVGIVPGTRSVDRFLRFHTEQNNVQDAVGHSRDDRGAARAADGHERSAVFVQNDGRAHGGQRILERSNRVHAGRIGAEVAHFVVQNETVAIRNDLGTEDAVDREGDGDDVAFLISHDSLLVRASMTSRSFSVSSP